MSIMLRTLWCFLGAASAGGVSAGARRMGLAQSTVSAAVRAVEDELGARLFEQTPLGARLTLTGARLAEHAARLALEVEQAFADLHSGRVGRTEPRSVAIVGAPPGCALDWAVSAAVLANARRGGDPATRLSAPVSADPPRCDVAVGWRLAQPQAPPAAGAGLRDEWRLLTLRGGASDAPVQWDALANHRVLTAPFAAAEVAALACGGVQPEAVELDRAGAHFTLLDRKDAALLIPAACLSAGHASTALSVRAVAGAPMAPEITVSAPGGGDALQDLARALLAEAARTAAQGGAAHLRLRSVDARIDLHTLRCFAATMETGNTARAAQACGIVQPALSVQLKKLEHALKRTLFDRSSAGMAASDAGVRLYDMAGPILAEHEAAIARLKEEAHGPGRRAVKIGVIPAAGEGSLVARAVAAALQDWRGAHPDAALSVAEGYSAVLTRWLRAHLIDVAILDTLDQQPGLTITPLLREPMVLVAAPGSRWDVGAPAIEGRALSDGALIAPSQRFGLRPQVEKALALAGAAFRPAMEVDGLAITLRLVRTGRHATILPPSAVHDDLLAGRLVARLIVEPRIERRLCLAERGPGPPKAAAAALRDCIADAFRALAPGLAQGPD